MAVYVGLPGHGGMGFHATPAAMKAPRTTMLDYCKYVLQRVSFDVRLFRKEYRKSLRWLSRDEIVRLKEWVRTNQSLNQSI